MYIPSLTRSGFQGEECELWSPSSTQDCLPSMQHVSLPGPRSLGTPASIFRLLYPVLTSRSRSRSRSFHLEDDRTNWSKESYPKLSSPGNTNRSPLTIISQDCHLRGQRHGSEHTVTRLCSELGAPTGPEHSFWIVVECLFILSANIPERLGTVARRQGRSTRAHRTPSEVWGTERP